jgi:hypothetical protein
VQVGNWDGTSFTAANISGNALQIYPTTNLTSYIRFYVATNTAAFCNLYQLASGGQPPALIASNIINQTVFQMQDYQGNVWANGQGNYTIQMTLQFLQLDYTIPTNTYDYYTLQTLMTPRIQN